MIKNINPEFGMGVEFNSVEEMYEEVKQLMIYFYAEEKFDGDFSDYWDGILTEGKDYEVI